MKFRSFLTEAGFSAGAYGADARFGYWKLPSLNLSGVRTGYLPPGGFQNITHAVQWQQNLHHFNDPDYIFARALEKLAELAENVVVGIENRQRGMLVHGHHYERAYLSPDPARGPMIGGLTENDIISGLFPRLRHEDMRKAEQMGVLMPQPDRTFMINTDKLREQMTLMRDKLTGKEHRYQATSAMAGAADKAIGAMTQGGRVGMGPNINPFVR